MSFYWNDGGRAASGFSGFCGDCVARSIAIGTGRSYRTVYDELGERANTTPRNGLPIHVARVYLENAGWSFEQLVAPVFTPESFPAGTFIVHLISTNSRRAGHMSCVINGTVHDTWNPAADESFQLKGIWASPANAPSWDPSPSQSESRNRGEADQSKSPSSELNTDLTQQEFERILRRLRALDNTANNDASTEGEKRNALVMMQALLLRHNLSREDLDETQGKSTLQFGKFTCVLNGSRACTWEHGVAQYLCEEIFPLVQYFSTRKGKRTLFHFYGPYLDSSNCMELFRELIVTIAAAAQVRFKGYYRGSGASYAEGYVQGLPRSQKTSSRSPKASSVTSTTPGKLEGDDPQALITARSMIVHETANQWLFEECGIQLVTSTKYSRSERDFAAESLGKTHGASHEIKPPNRPIGIGHKK